MSRLLELLNGPPLPLALVFFVVGLVLLVKAADWLVDGSARMAEALGISKLVVGLTVVAFGTSAPELAAGVSASLKGVNDFVVGTIVGSNIANVALILGATAVFRAVPTPRSV
ncbi:MAG: calcium/sodium antiporter, partial [Planctomycetota bacterium]